MSPWRYSREEPSRDETSRRAVRRDASVERTRRTSLAVPRRDGAPDDAPRAAAVRPAEPALAEPVLGEPALGELVLGDSVLVVLESVPGRDCVRGVRLLFLLRSTNSATDRRSVVLRARDVV